MERDAIALGERSMQVAKKSESSLTRNGGANSLQNNLLVNNSTNNEVIFNIQNSAGVHIGNSFHLNWTPGCPQVPAQLSSANQIAEEAKVYRKTRSVAELMRSTEPLSEPYLDIFSENFGDRYLQLPILLQIDDLFVQRMKEDYFHSGQSREVSEILFNT